VANKPEVRYINHYISGTAAPKLVPQPVRQKKPRLPKPKAQENRELLLQVDPVAIVGILVAAVMLVLMVVGVSRLYDQRAQVNISAGYLEQLQAENAQLKDTYAAGYDLEEIERLALALGMVPKDTLVQEQIQVSFPRPVEEPTRWENFWSFVKGLFA
jgi:hypothetical protein